MTTIMNSDWAVEAHGLVKTFGDNRAVDGIDLSVRTGVHNCWDFHYSKRKVPGPRRLPGWTKITAVMNTMVTFSPGGALGSPGIRRTP